MIITHLGKQFFKLQTGDMVIATNPISKASKHKTSGFGADIALISENHPDYNGADVVQYGDREPFVIKGPGEYEVSDIMFRGFASKGTDGKNELINTIYYFEFDGIKVCYLGALYDDVLPADAREAIDHIDILFIPIGGRTVVGAEAAAKIARLTEARLVIPMDYGDDQDSGSLKTFLKEMSAKDVSPVDKLTLKPKDLAGKELEVVVFE